MENQFVRTTRYAISVTVFSAKMNGLKIHTRKN